MTGWEVLILLAIVGFVWLLLDGVRVREKAIDAAREACEREHVQFLDETVSRARLRLERDELQRMKILRTYAFEYSVSGNDRFPGHIAMLGHTVSLVEVSVHGRDNVVFLNRISEKSE